MLSYCYMLLELHSSADDISDDVFSDDFLSYSFPIFSCLYTIFDLKHKTDLLFTSANLMLFFSQLYVKLLTNWFLVLWILLLGLFVLTSFLSATAFVNIMNMLFLWLKVQFCAWIVFRIWNFLCLYLESGIPIYSLWCGLECKFLLIWKFLPCLLAWVWMLVFVPFFWTFLICLYVSEYGRAFSDVVQGVEHLLENLGSDQISAPSSFKYRVALEKQVRLLEAFAF